MAFFYLFTTAIFAQFSRNDAINLVLNTVLYDNIGNIDVYCSYNSQTTSVNLIDNDSKPNPYAESWVFFSDDNPFASWYHSSRMIYVSAIDGSYTIENVEIYPKGLKTNYEEVSLANRPASVTMVGTAFTPDPEAKSSDYNYALIIVSTDNPRNWFNTSLVYNVLIDNYNYPEENIFVLYSWDGNSTSTPNYNDLDGDGSYDDINGPATWSNIQSTIADLTTSLGHSDQLAVFFTGVPVNTAGPEPLMGFPIDDQFFTTYPVSGLSQPMEDIDCGQMILTFDVNSSADVSSYFEAANGTNVKCHNRYLHGPTASGETNYAEMYFSGGNYSEQLFYWASAARGWLPDVYGNAPWNVWNDFGQLGLENGGGDYGTYIPNHPGDFTLDSDGDSFIQMEEAFNYATMLNTWTIDDCHIPWNPFLPDPNPVETDEFPFVDDLLTLSGLIGNIGHPGTFPSRSYIIANTYPPVVYSLSIEDGINISFADNAEIYCHYANIWSGTNSQLHFGEGTIIEGYNPLYSELDFVGTDFTIGKNSTVSGIYTSLPFYTVEELVLEDISFYNLLNFIYYGDKLNISGCTFKYSNFISNLHDAEISESTFDFCTAYLESTAPPDSDANIKKCNFNGISNFMGISLIVKYFDQFDIDSNMVTNSDVGIYVDGSGWRKRSYLTNNTVNNCITTGVSVYYVKALMEGNYIHDNSGTGLTLNTVCDVRIVGNHLAHDVDETQRIMDNGGFEILSAVAESFPSKLGYNAIIDDDNNATNDYLVKCGPLVINDLIVVQNYWGNNFNPTEDFFPTYAYDYLPIFYLNYNAAIKSDAELLFDLAEEKYEQGDYSTAQSTYKQIVEQYPGTGYAHTAMKTLINVAYNYNNDFNTLKQFYTSDSIILADSSLTKLGDFLGNQCEVMLQNWPTAIDWFENKILNPPSFADSIYAIIDLERTYLLMQQGGTKSSHYIGSMPEYIPESSLAHTENTQYLLSLLPGDSKNNILEESLGKLKPGELLQNAPNPFKVNTQIWYKLDNTANIAINIFDYTGKRIKTFKQGTINEGTHSVSFSSEGLAAGIYFYTIEVNGSLSDSKKMTILK